MFIERPITQLVADDFHHRGIGSALMKAICDIARSRGIKAIIGQVLAGNSDMLALMKRLGFVEDRDPDDGDLRRVMMML